MERGKKDKAEDVKPGVGPAPATTRFTSPLVITSASRRKSLFSRSTSNDGATARPSSSDSASDANVPPSTNTRIPRLVQRHGFTLTDAYRLAEEEELAQGSPSPAPRMWRSRRASVEKGRILNTKKPGVPDTSQRRDAGLRPSVPGNGDDHGGDLAIGSQQDDSDSTFDEKLRQFARDQAEPENAGRRGNGLLSRSKLGTRIVETGKELLRKPSHKSMENTSPARATNTSSESPSFLRRLSGRSRESGDSPSARASSDLARPDEPGPRNDDTQRPSTIPGAEPSTVLPDSRTPNRSFAWQADADFTAGDLQVSTSPPVAIRRSNTKIDQIRALEAEVNRLSFESSDRKSKADLDNEPHGLASDAAPRLADGVLHSGGDLRDTQGTKLEVLPMTARDPPLDPGNAVTKDLRSREIDSLVLAPAGLGEFRQDVGTPGSPCADVNLTPYEEAARPYSPLRDRLRRRDREKQPFPEHPEGSCHRPGTFATADPSHRRPENTSPDAASDAAVRDDRKHGATSPQQSDALRNDLHRSATTIDIHLAGEAQATVDNAETTVRDREFVERTRQRRSIGSAKDNVGPTVGFVGLSRSSSVESRAAKRVSTANSDSDPTERIEGEMKLFAPQENQSEKGSLRASSPVSDGGAPKETPKPDKIDRLTQPTPRVTGAYVDTPATVKEERPAGLGGDGMIEFEDVRPSEDGSRHSSIGRCADRPPTAPAGEKGGATARQQKRSQSSKGDRAVNRSSSVSARRRARSLSRTRKPLINSARPPTVKDDLLEIQQANQIDDSTLDDIADFLDRHDQGPALFGSQVTKPEMGDNAEDELELYGRMSRSLETGLLGIRSAKQGIERLEDQVAHADTKNNEQHKTRGSRDKGATPCPACDVARPQMDVAATYVRLALPRLWHRQPKFRFTFLGLALFLLTSWYIVESLLCFRYCRPDFCYPGTVCDWSADDPLWGYAIPVKLDQWATGGQGRALVHRLRPEVADWLADLWDMATGTEPGSVDTTHLTWEQKTQYRRRLARKGLLRPSLVQPNGDAAFRDWTSARETTERKDTMTDMGGATDGDDH